MNLLRLPF
uniref:Uncharacterized protein n=1 Tax=Arundo donax TaxID=35708 RepID=A0A0A9F1D2_ARUDO